jgi:hypothetical protein
MIYELAKELKEAGFLQGGKGNWIGPPEALSWRHADRVYQPTLSELIEACRLQPQQSFDLSTGNDGGSSWKAQALGGKYVGMGKAPEEAVAHLWLALQMT